MACIVHAKINVAASTCGLGIKQRIGKTASLLVFKDRFPKIININCFSSEDKRGFGPPPMKKKKPQKIKAPAENLGVTSQTSDTSRSDASIGMAPSLSNSPAGKPSSTISDHQFEEKLEAVKRSVKEQKKTEKDKLYQAIDYDAPTDSEPNKTGLGYKIGIGVAVVVFGIVFAVGDFLPFGSDSAKNKPSIAEKQLSKEEKTILQTRLQEYDMILSTSPDDPVALEGAAVTLAELGEYNRAASVLETFIKEKPKNPEAYRLLGEVKYELKDYEGSVVAYKNAKSVSESASLEILRGLTNSLLATKRPDEAVQILLETRENIKSLKSNGDDFKADKSDSLEEQIVDPVQIELLLGKAYSYWGRISDAVSVYDQLISTHPNDFRGYLAKGIILKENGKVGDAERMFIQARFFAPEKTKVLVDRYSR